VKPKVIFVMGAGHSGSTILGMTLGNAADVFFAGEIARWLRYDGKPRLPGEERAAFWSKVREQIEIPAEVQGKKARAIEQSTAAFRPLSRLRQRRLRNPYRRATTELFEAIARTADATHVVDTSHFPRRARELQQLDGIDLYLVFVVRDAQSVIASYGREGVPHKQTWKMGTTNAYLWLTYLLSLGVFRRHPRERRLFVRHEDFVADPAAVVADILRQAGSTAEVPDLTVLSTGLAFQGNRLLRTEDRIALRLHPDDPERPSRLTALIHTPWRSIFARLGPRAGAKT
jgi:Sulfotransferase family